MTEKCVNMEMGPGNQVQISVLTTVKEQKQGQKIYQHTQTGITFPFRKGPSSLFFLFHLFQELTSECLNNSEETSAE